jgi:two-component system, LuxR family, sensor kinase FixL
MSGHPTPLVPGGDPAEILSAIVESSEDAIIGQRLDGTVVSWNRGAERLYGYTTTEMIGRSAIGLYKSGPAEHQSIVERIGSGQRVDAYEAVRIVKGGQPVHVRASIWPVRDATLTIVGALAIEWDATERVRLELALQTTEARWRAVIDSAVDGIIVIDARGLIEAMNPAAERMFAYAEREVRGRNVNILMPSPYREEHDRYIRHYLETGEHKIIGIGREVTALRRDGTTFPVHLSVGEMHVGDERHFTGILHDLSARVRLEEQLREQSALARLGEMAAVIAHEVRNPLAAVRGAIQVIGSRLPTDSKDAPVTKEILARLDALNGLLNDLLLFARTPEPRFAPVSLAGLLTLTTDLLARDPAFREIRVQLSGDPPPIIADAELLKIVFQNLLINAAQAMQNRGVIEARITTEDSQQRVTVTDQGPGIPAEVRERLFRPFFTTKARGTGLGLSVAKRLVELHGGTIAITCPREGGTAVTVRLPASAIQK